MNGKDSLIDIMLFCKSKSVPCVISQLPEHTVIVIWIDGKEYDLCCSFTSHTRDEVLTRAYEKTVAFVNRMLGDDQILKQYPMMELVRFSSTGTEAVATATRLARTHTGRSRARAPHPACRHPVCVCPL